MWGMLVVLAVAMIGCGVGNHLPVGESRTLGVQCADTGPTGPACGASNSVTCCGDGEECGKIADATQNTRFLHCCVPEGLECTKDEQCCAGKLWARCDSGVCVHID